MNLVSGYMCRLGLCWVVLGCRLGRVGHWEGNEENGAKPREGSACMELLLAFNFPSPILAFLAPLGLDASGI